MNLINQQQVLNLEKRIATISGDISESADLAAESLNTLVTGDVAITGTLSIDAINVFSSGQVTYVNSLERSATFGDSNRISSGIGFRSLEDENCEVIINTNLSSSMLFIAGTKTGTVDLSSSGASFYHPSGVQFSSFDTGCTTSISDNGLTYSGELYVQGTIMSSVVTGISSHTTGSNVDTYPIASISKITYFISSHRNSRVESCMATLSWVPSSGYGNFRLYPSQMTDLTITGTVTGPLARLYVTNTGAYTANLYISKRAL